MVLRFFLLVLGARVDGVLLLGTQVDGDLALGGTGDLLLQALLRRHVLDRNSFQK
jgi:hypothetical protein